ncbi:MAG: hypothetical protein M0D55_14045 [Elusimicrobiota bacterium]|nr:MAG: hypothetical protein M0D55_14045 [Elusimicrobiota bacterium]
MAKILAENPTARQDAAKRFEEFLLNAGPDGKSFVGEGVDKVRLGALARSWGEKDGSPGSVANLYFVLGPGLTQPGWAAKEALLKSSFVTPNRWESRLRTKLVQWTDEKGAQITKTKEASAATAFFLKAAEEATTVYSEARSRKELDADIERRDDPTNVPDTRNRAGGGRTSLDGASRQYTLDDLYRDGAAWGDVAGPKDANSRRISIKIFSTRADDGTIYNEIGIFDITDNNDIFGQRFPLNSKDQSFVLDDRTPGHKKYELSFGTADANGNRTIKFGRPGGGPAIETSVGALLMKRADQAESMGNIVRVGDQDFYALPQGGARGVIGLFPKGMIDDRAGTKDARDLAPTLYAEVGLRGQDGRNQNVPAGPKGGPHLGKVGGREYHLEWNAVAKTWEVKEGAGDMPEKPKPPTTGTGDPTSPGGGTTTPGGGTTTPTPGGEGSIAIADLEALLLKSPECKKNPDDTKDLAANLKGKYGIISCTSEIEGTQQIILVPKSDANPSQQLKYGNSTSGGQTYKLLRARFADHYLVLVFDKQVQYLDLLKQAEGGFALAGFVADKNASKFQDVVIFVDALKHYMALTGADTGALTAVPERLRAAVGSKAYSLTGAYANGALIVTVTSGGETFSIWPKVTKPGAPDATPNPYENINGPATAMESSQGTVSSANEPFPATQDMPESRQIKQVKATADIALYESVDLAGQTEPKKYYVMFKYKALDGEKEAVFRQKQFEVFNSTSPLPESYEMQGLIGAGDPVVKNRMQAGFRFLTGSTKGKGGLVVVQNKALSGPNQQDAAANCVGPIVWWGMDRATALEACRKDKL